MNTGKYIRTEEIRKKISETMKSRGIKPTVRYSGSGEELYNWKGEGASYHSKHAWIHRHRGKAKMCSNENCSRQNVKIFHWANLSGRYKRDFNDYIQLCPSCHRYFDKGKLIL